MKLNLALLVGSLFLLGACVHSAPMAESEREPAATSTNFVCYGDRYDSEGVSLGEGETLIVMMDNGSMRLVDRGSAAIRAQLMQETPAERDLGRTFRTPSTRSGLGVFIHEVNVTAKLGSQVNLFIFPIKNDRAGKRSTLNCRVTQSNYL